MTPRGGIAAARQPAGSGEAHLVLGSVFIEEKDQVVRCFIHHESAAWGGREFSITGAAPAGKNFDQDAAGPA
jgi:hypothetical protein